MQPRFRTGDTVSVGHGRFEALWRVVADDTGYRGRVDPEPAYKLQRLNAPMRVRYAYESELHPRRAG